MARSGYRQVRLAVAVQIREPSGDQSGLLLLIPPFPKVQRIRPRVSVTVILVTKS